jgi:hypothetical protein
MGWSIGYDSKWNRDIGYGVPSICDHPSCNKEIDRGLSHVCGDAPYGGERGCGLYFCVDHQVGKHQRCEQCTKRRKPFSPKPDTLEWLRWKLQDESWQQWRDENPAELADLQKRLEQPHVG